MVTWSCFSFHGCLLIRPLKGADGDPRILRVGNVWMCVAYLYLVSVLDAIICDAHNTIDTECAQRSLKVYRLPAANFSSGFIKNS